MRWLPLATIAILTPGGSILTRDVGATMKLEPINPKNPAVGDGASIRQSPSLLETGGTAGNQMNSPNKAFHHYGALRAPRVNADVGT